MRYNELLRESFCELAGRLIIFRLIAARIAHSVSVLNYYFLCVSLSLSLSRLIATDLLHAHCVIEELIIIRCLSPDSFFPTCGQLGIFRPIAYATHWERFFGVPELSFLADRTITTISRLGATRVM